MVRVLIVEEVRAVCEVIANALRREADINVIGYATNLAEAGSQLVQCDMVLINAARHQNAYPPLIRTIRQLTPRVRVLAMGLSREQHLLLPYILAGVSSYVFQDDTFDELLKNIRMAGNDNVFVGPPGVTKLMPQMVDLVDLNQQSEVECGGPEALTRREWEVLTLIQQGQTNQEIAEALVIELGTAKNHVHNILRKLNVNSRRDAAHVSKLVSFRGWRGEKAAGRPYQYAPGLS